MTTELLSPNTGLVTATDPKPVAARPTSIPTDSLLAFDKVHPAETGLSIIEFSTVDALFHPEKLGPISLTFQIPDLLAVLDGDDKKMLTATHTITSVRGFSPMNTLAESVANDAQGLGRYPLLTMTARLYFAKNFFHRLAGPGFAAMLGQRRDDYLVQLDNAAQLVEAIGRDAPRPDLDTRLVEEHMTDLRMTFSGHDIALSAPQTMLSPNDRDNTVFALALPVKVNHEPYPIPQRLFALERIACEKRLVQAYLEGVDLPAAEATMSELAANALIYVFNEVQGPFQESFYCLQQACRPGPRGKVGTPFRLVNMSLDALTVDDGAALKKLLKKLPGRRATDFSHSVDTIVCFDELTDERAAMHLGRFAEEVRAVVVTPIHMDRTHEQAARIHKSLFPTLHGIQKPEDSWKRYLSPIAGSYMADTRNLFRPAVPIPVAAIAAGLMIENADKIALPAAGDRMPIDRLLGEVSTGQPHDALLNTADPEEMPGVNSVNRRTKGHHVINGASTCSGEATFQLMSVTRCYNDLVKNISELALTKLFTEDTEPNRKAFESDVNKMIMSKSGNADTKSLNGGKVVSVEPAKGPDGAPIPGTVVLTMRVDFKYVLFGVEVKVVPEEVSLVLTKPGI